MPVIPAAACGIIDISPDISCPAALSDPVLAPRALHTPGGTWSPADFC